MPRTERVDIGDTVYHVINRANARVQIFDTDQDYIAFEKVLAEAMKRESMRILAYIIMPNHWHLVLYPRQDGDLSRFMRWLTMTHTQRWHATRKTTGSGHLYQGRYKSFICQTDEYFLQLVRYVERNALRANLVKRAEEWRWSSIWRREKGTHEQKTILSTWPIEVPENYLSLVNSAQSEAEEEALCRAIVRGNPYGDESWQKEIVKKFKLESTTRSRGRPRKGS